MSLRHPASPVLTVLASAAVAALAMLSAPLAHAGELRPAQSSDDLPNPHRGFLLWGTTVGADGGLPDNHYGASMYQIYVPWREIETADQQFDWAGFEQRHLAPILAENPKATFILRPVADYPDGVSNNISFYFNKTEGQLERDYPKFLELSPVNVVGHDYASCGGDGPGRAPEYNTPQMREQLRQFVTAFGQRYDGDPRITAIHVGLLGFWGEWHTSGCEAWEPDAITRQTVRDAYAAAFVQTPVHTRYARASDLGGTTFGISEDFFPSFTAMCSAYSPQMPRCDDTGWWNLEWGFRNEVPAARENWKSNPIGGESPYADQKKTWTSRTANIVKMLKDYHFTWLGPAGQHESAGYASQMRTIKRALGYEFTVRQVNWPDSMRAGAPIPLKLSVENTGSAPLYHLYQTELHWVDAGGTTRAKAAFDYPLNTLLPGAAPSLLDRTATVPATLAPGSYSLRLAIADTAPGRPGIAAQNSGRDTSGRLPLGTVTVAAAR
jgi:hypothetical protein